MSHTLPLYALQQTDNEIEARQQRLAEIIELLGETEELLAARKRLTSIQEQLPNWRIQQRDLDLKVQSIQQKKRLSEQRLYSGKIRNPKELSDLQQEIASLNRRQEALEDDLLESMMQIEEGEAEEQAAAAWLEKLGSEWRDSQDKLKAEKESQEQQLAGLGDLYNSQSAKIPAADLKSYQHLRQRKGGLAVALLQDAECQGCMASLPSSKVKEARGGQIAYCGTCGRIMYVG